MLRVAVVHEKSFEYVILIKIYYLICEARGKKFNYTVSIEVLSIFIV